MNKETNKENKNEQRKNDTTKMKRKGGNEERQPK